MTSSAPEEELTLCTNCGRQTRTHTGICVECWAVKDVAALPPGFRLITREPQSTTGDFLYSVAKAIVVGLLLMIALMLRYGFATDGSSPF